MSIPAARRVLPTSAGPVHYVDTGGDGPVLVLAHGLLMNHRLWDRVLPQLAGHRCLLPTLPLGAHPEPMLPDADLSHRGVARLLGEFLRRLDLSDVTLVANDWGGAQFTVLEPGGDRVARLALVACEAFDNFPPGAAAGLLLPMRVPGGARLVMALLRTRFMRHDRRTFGSLTLRGIPDDILDEWFEPATRDVRIRRDLARFATCAPDAATLLGWSREMAAFRGQVLIVWADEDRLMPRDHGPRLAELFHDARLVRIPDSATAVPLDDPDTLAAHLRTFAAS